LEGTIPFYCPPPQKKGTHGGVPFFPLFKASHSKYSNWLPSVVSEGTPLEFYLFPKYYPVFDKGLQRGKKLDFSQTKF